MIGELQAWADDQVVILSTIAVLLLILVGREVTMIRRRTWSLRLGGLDRVDAASGVQSYAGAASLIFPSELAVAHATGREVCLLLIRVEDGDPAEAAQYLSRRVRKYEHVVRIEYHLMGCLLLVRDRAEAVRAAGRLLDGLDADDLPFRIIEAAVAETSSDGEELIDLIDRASTRFIPIARFQSVSDMVARLPAAT